MNIQMSDLNFADSCGAVTSLGSHLYLYGQLHKYGTFTQFRTCYTQDKLLQKFAPFFP